jgi:hypothetical protein
MKNEPSFRLEDTLTHEATIFEENKMIKSHQKFRLELDQVLVNIF